MNVKMKCLLLILVLGVSGCQKEKDDLQAYVAKVKGQQKSDIPPIPVMKPYQKFEYAASDLRDPFVPTVVELPEPEEEAIIDNGISPDKNRRKEVLESYALSELQYVGNLEQESVWALIRSSDGIIHRVKNGNFMGKNHGQIQSINESELVLEEIVPNARQGYIKQKTVVSAVEVR
jgi:type IV pilus assembly protein PilP